MNIDFNVLCIDDDDDFGEQLKLELNELIEEHNLLPNVHIYKEYSTSQIRKIGNKYDLILVDYNLPNKKYGTQIIAEIRKSSMLPDIIFYSSTSSIEDILSKEKNDKRQDLLNILQKGIYFSNANDVFELSDQVINKIVSREEKINGFIGIVLSFVSEYEKLANEIIQKSLKTKLDLKMIDIYIERKLLTKMKTDIEKSHRDFISDTFIHKSSRVLDQKNRRIDHSKRVRVMCEILKHLGYQDFIFESYSENVLKLRNSLSHVKMEQKGDEQFYIFEMDGSIIKLDHDFCKKQRSELLFWKEEFSKINRFLDSL